MKAKFTHYAFFLLLFCSFQASAQKTPGGGGAPSNIHSLSIYNQSAQTNCETVQLMINYTLNGIGYTQVSPATSLSASASHMLYVTLPSGAVVISKHIKFNMEGYVTIIHPIGNNFVDYVAPTGSLWCTTNNVDVLELKMNYSSGTNTSTAKYETGTL